MAGVGREALKCRHCGFEADAAVQLFAACEKCGRAFTPEEESNNVCDDCYRLFPESIPRRAQIIAAIHGRWLRVCSSCFQTIPRPVAPSTSRQPDQVRPSTQPQPEPHVPRPSAPPMPELCVDCGAFLGTPVKDVDSPHGHALVYERDKDQVGEFLRCSRCGTRHYFSINSVGAFIFLSTQRDPRGGRGLFGDPQIVVKLFAVIGLFAVLGAMISVLEKLPPAAAVWAPLAVGIFVLGLAAIRAWRSRK